MESVFYPLTSTRWSDLERLFGGQGACGGCWRMRRKLRRSDFIKQKGEKSTLAMKKLADSGEVQGILAYIGTEPVGWCAVAPRETYPVLERSLVLRRVDDELVWSVVCFYVAKQFRRKGLTSALLKASIEHAKMHGGIAIEGYPVEPKTGRLADVFAYTGLVSTFRKAGFTEVAKRSEARPIMRYSAKPR